MWVVRVKQPSLTLALQGPWRSGTHAEFKVVLVTRLELVIVHLQEDAKRDYIQELEILAGGNDTVQSGLLSLAPDLSGQL